MDVKLRDISLTKLPIKYRVHPLLAGDNLHPILFDMNEVIKSAHLIAIMVMIVTVRPNSERDVPTIEMTVSANLVAGGNS